MRLLQREEDGDFSQVEIFGDNVPGYAILSHTWGNVEDEVTFEDLRRSSGKDKAGYRKIQFCEKQAANDGLQYFWVDTCCIDKSSSAELAEAINSMFRWYRNAAKCYVYLSDVSTSWYDANQSSSITWQAAFRKSKWFTRGWTLQELIAPASVEFFSSEGERLGDKRSMEQQVHEITGIALPALRANPLSEFSVTERMLWATNRKTTRIEDEAYSLLGIFDIHIPLIYGEGKKAFSRLKEEIEKQSNEYVITITDIALSRSEIHRWLSPSNVADDLQRYLENCMPGSCDWILTCPYMQKFLSSASLALGHLRGRPGAGKSTAVGFIIKHLLSFQGPIVLYFFCKANDVEKQLPIQVLRTILSQLLRVDEQLYQFIRDIHVQSGRIIADCLADVEAALAAVFAHIRYRQIFIIVDALDECHDAPKLLESIFRCVRSAQTTTRVLVSSRPMALDILPGYEIRIDEVQSTAAFIEAYIAQRINANGNLRGTDLGRRVVAEVSRAADGLWVYARLMMDEIARLASSALIERQLQTFPRGLTQLYTQILRSSEQHFSSEQIRFAQQVFLWLDVNDYLPDFLFSGYKGLSYKTLSLILEYVNFGQPVFNPIALAKELCSPLIEIHDIGPSDIRSFQNSITDSLQAPHDFEIEYVHHTAQQYILASPASPLIDIPLVLRPRRFRYFHRAAVAMWYFSESSVLEKDLRSLRASPRTKSWDQSYFDMSYGLWGALKLSEFEINLYPEEIPELTAIVHTLSNFITSTKCLKWVETAVIINYTAEYHHLLQNATEALEAAVCADTSGMTIWKEYQDARLRFLSTYVYVLGLTGPPLPLSSADQKHLKPAGFDHDPLAHEIPELGNTWQQIRQKRLVHLWSNP